MNIKCQSIIIFILGKCIFISIGLCFIFSCIGITNFSKYNQTYVKDVYVNNITVNITSSHVNICKEFSGHIKCKDEIIYNYDYDIIMQDVNGNIYNDKIIMNNEIKFSIGMEITVIININDNKVKYYNGNYMEEFLAKPYVCFTIFFSCIFFFCLLFCFKFCNKNRINDILVTYC